MFRDELILNFPIHSSLRGGAADAAIQLIDSFWIASPSARNDENWYLLNQITIAAKKIVF